METYELSLVISGERILVANNLPLPFTFDGITITVPFSK